MRLQIRHVRLPKGRSPEEAPLFEVVNPDSERYSRSPVRIAPPVEFMVGTYNSTLQSGFRGAVRERSGERLVSGMPGGSECFANSGCQ